MGNGCVERLFLNAEKAEKSSEASLYALSVCVDIGVCKIVITHYYTYCLPVSMFSRFAFICIHL